MNIMVYVNICIEKLMCELRVLKYQIPETIDNSTQNKREPKTFFHYSVISIVVLNKHLTTTYHMHELVMGDFQETFIILLSLLYLYYTRRRII